MVTIILVCLLLYGHTLDFKFVFDDYIYLVDNPLAQDPKSFLFLSDFTAFANKAGQMGLDPDLSTSFILRPVAYLTFYLNYMADGMNPRWFRAVNILIHCANGLLLFHILRTVMLSSPKRGSLSAASAGFIALGTALVFVAHPLQIESVTYIAQRFTSLAGFFYLITISTWLLADSARTKAGRIVFRIISVSAMVLGMLTKEASFTAPVVLVIIDCLLMGKPLRSALRRAVPYLVFLPLIPALVFATSAAQHGGKTDFILALNVANSLDTPIDQFHYALTQIKVVASYIKLIVLPLGLNVDHDMPLATSVSDPQVLSSALILLGLVAVSYLFHRIRRGDLRRTLMFFGIIWFFVCVAISSSIIPLPDVMAEHRSYLPSVGIILLLVCGADLIRSHLSRSRWWAPIMPVLLSAWVVSLGTATTTRHEVWRTALSLWTDTVAKSPGKYRPWHNLGCHYNSHGKPDDAVSCFKKALEIEPRLVIAYENIASIQNVRSNFSEALEFSLNGLKLNPNRPTLHYNLGVARCGLGQVESGIQSLRNAVAIDPRHARAHVSLGLYYRITRDYDRALKHFQTAMSIQPENVRLKEIISEVGAEMRRQSAAN